MKTLQSIATLAICLATGCSAPSITAVTLTESAATVQKTPWRKNLLPTEGITVEMPGIADERTITTPLGREDKLFYHNIAYESADKSMRFEAGAYSAVVQRRQLSQDEMLDEARTTMAQMERKREVTFGDYKGFALTGTTEAGKVVAMRAYFVGEHMYTLRVEGDARAKVEEEAERFFSSFQLQMPFRIFVSRTDYYSIARPMLAKYQPLNHKLDGPPEMTMLINLFSLSDDDAYSITVVPTAADTNEPDVADEVLENAVTGLAKREGSIVEKLSSITLDGGFGRDLTIKKSDDIFIRTLLVTKNRRMYIVSRTSRRREQMTDADANTFFGSLSIGNAP